MSTNEHSDSPGKDALAHAGLRKVFRRQRQQSQARQQVVAAAEAIVNAQHLEVQQTLVPQMVEELLNLISELYNLYRTEESPNFNDATLIEVIDHEAKARLDAEKKTWWQRLHTLFLERHAYPYSTLYEMERRPVKRLYCWTIAWIDQGKTSPFVSVYLSVDKGRIYTTPLTNVEWYDSVADAVSAEQLYQLNYLHVMELTRRIQNKIDWVKMVTRDREIKRTLNEDND